MDLSNGYYIALLETIEHFFEGETDQQAYEEGVRYIFGIEAYTMFTVDKVIQALIKQVSSIFSFLLSCLKSIQRFKRWQRTESPSSYLNYSMK